MQSQNIGGQMGGKKGRKKVNSGGCGSDLPPGDGRWPSEGGDLGSGSAAVASGDDGGVGDVEYGDSEPSASFDAGAGLTESDLAALVQQRAEELLPPEEIPEELEPVFVKSCLDANERGDGVLFATLNRGKYIYNTTPRDGEWYRWAGHVWEKDDFSQSFNAVEPVALEYLQNQMAIETEIVMMKGLKKKIPPWMTPLKDKYEKRVSRLRGKAGADKALFWAPIVDQTMACRESDFDRKPWLLPVKNGVIDLESGNLIKGRPDDMLRMCLDIEYDPHADYTPIFEFLSDICCDPLVKDTENIPGFIKRVLGCAATGFSNEQYIFVFLGPGRNGKGVLFNLLADVMGPYYHEINRSMILEQRNEPSPSAASEHKFSLLGKRIIVGAETNKGQKIDASGVKGLTGNNLINARPNFGKEIVFRPTHNLFLQTNNMPYGLTAEFSLVQRLMMIELPWRYVDDPVAEAKKYPAQADRFREKDALLEEKLKEHRQGFLRMIVEGCLEYQQRGLDPPDCILQKVNELAKEDDYFGQFIEDCLVHVPGRDSKITSSHAHDALRWWWSVNMDDQGRRVPSTKSLNKTLRDRGFNVDKKSGVYHVFETHISFDVSSEVDAYVRNIKGKS